MKTNIEMKAQGLLSLAATLAAALAAGCDGGRPEAWDRARSVFGPVPLKAEIAWVDGARDRVVIVAAGETPRVSGVKIGRKPITAVPSPDREKLLVLTRGEEGLRADEPDEPPALWVVDADGGAPPVRYAIGSPFDRVAVAADGSVAVAYYSAAGPDDSGVFRNPNELAIVDLTAPPAEGGDAPNPVLRTVRSFGGAPLGVVLSPPMALPGAEDATPRTFAFVLAPNVVTVLDATHPARREVSVRLALGAALVVPREVVFAPHAATAYLRADGARDVLQVGLTAEPPSSTTDNDFQPSLAELGAGGAPADVAVFDDVAGVRRVVAVTPGTHEVTIIDADTAQFIQVDVGDPVDRVLLLPVESPRVALVASLGVRAPRVHLIALDALGDELVPPAVTTVQVGAPLFDAVAVPGRELVMLIKDDARTLLDLLDVTQVTTAPIEGAGQLDAYDFSAGGGYLVGATTGLARIGFVDLGNLHPSDLRLDAVPASVHALPSGAVVIDHGEDWGHATFLPHAGATRAEATVLAGFLLDGILDEEF